jgi:hypothetical protein
MNAVYEHHKNSIRFQYCCFDRILPNDLIQPFQQEQRAIGFFGTCRDLYSVSRDVLREIATQVQNWMINRSKKWGAPIPDAPEGAGMISSCPTSQLPNQTRSSAF